LVWPADLQDWVLPSGRLREPLGAARFADALLVPGTEEDVTHVASALGHSTAFRVVPRYADLGGRGVSASPSGGPDKARPPGERVLAFAGIARPERFFDALRSLGYDVAREITFRDHHWYGAADVSAIQQAARDANATLI